MRCRMVEVSKICAMLGFCVFSMFRAKRGKFSFFCDARVTSV